MRLRSGVKRKYYEKTLSESAIGITFERMLNIGPLFAEFAWLNISVFDLSELGLGLLYTILPIDYEPYAVDFEYRLPTPRETLQGIWGHFDRVPFEKLYIWMTDFREYVLENIKEEYQPDYLIGLLPKAIYGITPWGRGIYDPIVAREFLRATFHRLRLLRTPDETWRTMLEQIAEFLEMIGVTDDIIFNRLMGLFSGQVNAFILGLSVLGRSRLTKMEGEWGVIPLLDATGRLYDVKFRTLDHLQFGFILGITPLGYGVLLPKESTYKLPEGKYNPAFLKVLEKKIRGMIHRISLSTWAYTNYHKPEEMIDFFKSEKADQYALLQTQRRFIEAWVSMRVPPEESNAVRIRQYQNAILQLTYWRVKRHRWGFGAWKVMTEEQFKEWWLDYWTRQGLSKDILLRLYEESRVWRVRVGEDRVRLGRRVKERKLRLALGV